MNPPIVLTNQITPKWIFITWSGISTSWQTGGDPASYYGIEWDQGNGNWVNLTTPGVGLTYSFNLTSSVPFVSGLTINLRGFAKNGVGVGVYSDITTVTCDKVPQYMNAPTVNTALNYVNPKWIYLQWNPITDPVSTGGDPATFYGLEWDKGTGVWVNLTTSSLGKILSFNFTSTTPFGSAVNL